MPIYFCFHETCDERQAGSYSVQTMSSKWLWICANNTVEAGIMEEVLKSSSCLLHHHGGVFPVKSFLLGFLRRNVGLNCPKMFLSVMNWSLSRGRQCWVFSVYWGKVHTCNFKPQTAFYLEPNVSIVHELLWNSIWMFMFLRRVTAYDFWASSWRGIIGSHTFLVLQVSFK